MALPERRAAVALAGRSCERFALAASGAKGAEGAMSSNKRVLILAGDGIGPEVMRQVERVMEWLSARRSIS